MTLTDTALVAPDILERVLASALRRGGQFAEVFVEDRTMTGISLDDRRVEELSSGHDRGAGIRVVVGETTGFAHTADLSEEGLKAAAEAAAAVAREGGGGVRRIELHRSRPTAPNEVRTLPSDVAKATKVDLLLRADDVARSNSDSIVQVSAGYGDSRRRIQVANSDGLLSG
ncbi:MAG: PmbA/TldA family metallopeptidase, partial [Acidimicrobiales bacterium]